MKDGPRLTSPSGSSSAIAHGCTCPVEDNRYGNGILLPDGEFDHYRDASCPLHGTPEGKAHRALLEAAR